MEARLNVLSTVEVGKRVSHGVDRAEPFAAQRAVALQWPDASEVSLRGGARVAIRSIRHGDLELERRFVAGLSPRTRYLSLFSSRELTPGELETWTDIDPMRRLALVAVVPDGDEEQQLGVARCARDGEEPTNWDFAVVVTDAWQRRGLGEALLLHLMQCAEGVGVETLSSLTLSTNQAMLSLARRLGFKARREPGDATVTRIERRLGPAWPLRSALSQ